MRLGEIASVLACILVTMYPCGLDKAMVASFITVLLVMLLQGRWKQVNPNLVVSTVLLALGTNFAG